MSEELKPDPFNLPPIPTGGPKKKNKAGNKRGWGEKHRKLNKEKVREKKKALIGSTPIPKDQKKTDAPKPVKIDIDLSDVAAKDHSVEQKAALRKLQELLVEQMQRKSEALKIWVPLPVQQKFHESKCRVRLARGANRSGKTNVAAVEVARCCTNSDPFNKYPKRGDVYIVSEQWGEIGRVIYPKLFKRGAFKVIRDKTTGHMRAFNPVDPADRERMHQAKDADPLIPKRYIARVAWHEKKLNQPKMIELKNGWTLHFFSGDSKPPSGSAIDLAWLDEEIPEQEWFVELNSRIAEREGVIIWTATPEIGTDQFHDYCQKAQEQTYLLPHERDVEEFQMSLADNPHISEKAKAGMASMLSEEDYQVRVLGNFATLGRIIFPEYKKMTHGIDYFPIPPTWTRYAAIDPGHQICAVLFGAVPDPKDMLERDDPFDVVLFDELYIPKCDARKFADAMEKKCRHQDWHEFVIDMHGSRVTEAGSGLSIYDQYRTALAEKGVTSTRNKTGFTMGDDDVASAIERCRYYLGNNPYSGHPRLRVMCKKSATGLFESLLPNFDHEIIRWKYKVDRGHATEHAETKGRVHLMATLRYLLGLNPRFVPPKAQPRSEAVTLIERMKREEARQHASPPSRTVFGPAGSY